MKLCKILTIIILILNNVGCVTTRLKKTHHKITIPLDGYYLSKDVKELFVKSDSIFFYSKLNTEQQAYFKSIVDNNKPKIPEIKYAKINKDGTFEAKLFCREMKNNKKILIAGKLIKSNKPNLNMNTPTLLNEIPILLPDGKTRKFLKTVATPVGFVLDVAYYTVIGGIIIGMVLTGQFPYFSDTP